MLPFLVLAGTILFSTLFGHTTHARPQQAVFVPPGFEMSTSTSTTTPIIELEEVKR